MATVLLKPVIEEAAAFAIINSLKDDQPARTITHPVAPADFVTRYVPRIGAVEYPDVRDLGMPQYRHLLTIVDRFLERHPQPIALKLQQDVRDRGLDHVHVAWAGDTRPGTSHYFRIQTERFLIEFVNAILDPGLGGVAPTAH